MGTVPNFPFSVTIGRKGDLLKYIIVGKLSSARMSCCQENFKTKLWKGGYMTMETLTTAHKALDGMVSGLQTKEPFQHVHGGQWVASSFMIPEPSGGLLTLVGLALLALRRRKVS